MVARSAEARERARARNRAYYLANKGYFRAYHADRGRRARWNTERRTAEYHARMKLWPSYGRWHPTQGPPPPQVEVDELTQRAMEIVGISSLPDPALDSGWRDLIQEAVLAMLEERDPAAAVKAERARMRADQIHVRDALDSIADPWGLVA